VQLENLEKIYQLGKTTVHALRGVSLTVREGEFTVVMGPSGSGKTTLLNLIGTLDKPTSGRALIDGEDIAKMNDGQLTRLRRHKIGFVFQFHNLIPVLTAFENVQLPLLTSRTKRGEAEDRANELLDRVGLKERAGHLPDELSGGEQQRVAIAAALANDPPLLLADEPTGELDSVNAKMVTDFLVKINRELGKTLIMVTHDQNVAKTANNIMRIEDGVIKSSLTPSQIASQDTSSSYLDQLRHRMSELEKQMRQLDDDFKTGKVSGDEYADQRLRLRQVKAGLQDELQRQGVIG